MTVRMRTCTHVGIVITVAFLFASGAAVADPQDAKDSWPAGSQWKNAQLLDEQTRGELARQEDRFRLQHETPVLSQWIQDLRAGDHTKAARAAALLGMSDTPEAARALEAIVAAPKTSNRVRWIAVRSLGRIGSRQSVPALIDLVDHHNREVRLYAKASLAEITGAYFGDNKTQWRQWLTDNASASEAKRKTAAKPEARSDAKVSSAKEAARRLREAIDERYSYRDLRGVDWDKMFAWHTRALEACKTPQQFAERAAKLLAPSLDMHISLSANGRTFRPFRRKIVVNYDIETLRKVVPQWRDRNECVSTGRFPDGIGYILIRTWAKGKAGQIKVACNALKQFGDTSGLIVDVRPNGGGSETVAADFAGCFVNEPTLYALHAYRDVRKPDGFGETQRRMLKPNKTYPTYSKPTMVLMGPECVSSCEGFLLMMKAVPNCTLVGGTSYGSSGNPKQVDLGNGVTVRLPSWKAMLPDGTMFEGKGITPDVEVKASPRFLRTRDRVLEAALRLLRKK